MRVHRLDKVLPGLTLFERLDALLAAYHNHAEFDRGLVRSMPDADAERWNRLTGLLGATHSQLGWYLEFVEATVTQLELRHGILLALNYGRLLLDQHLFDVLLDATGDDRRTGIIAKQDRLEALAEALVPRIVEELAGRWLDLRLAEIAADSIKVECAGRDLMHPDMRAKLADCKTRLLALKESLKFWVQLELPEPCDADVERLLAALEKEAEL